MEEQNITTARPKSFMWLAIISTVLTLFFPIGLISLYYAIKVNSYLKADEDDKAAKASSKAKIWGIIASVLGIVTIILSLLLVSLIIFFITTVLIPFLGALAASLPLITPLVSFIISFLTTLAGIMSILAEIAVSWGIIEKVFSTILLTPLF